MSYTRSSNTFAVTLRDGTRVDAAPKDSNGNQYSSSADTLLRPRPAIANAPNRSYTTPLGRTVTGPEYSTWTITDSTGVARTSRLDYTAIDVNTSFCGPPPCIEYAGGFNLVPSQLTVPGPSTPQIYQFRWYNNSANELQSIVLPTGGTISYTYGTRCDAPPFANPRLHPTYACRRTVLTRTVSPNGVVGTWTYHYVNGAGVATDPYGNDEVHSFAAVVNNQISSSGSVETSLKTYSGCSPINPDCSIPGSLLRTVTTDYTGDNGPLIPAQHQQLYNVRPIRKTLTLENGYVSQTETDYETFSYTSIGGTFTGSRLNVTARREYDYGSGVPGPLLRRTAYTYLHTGNTNYVSRNIVDRVTSTTVYDSLADQCQGQARPCTQTVNEYDVYTHTGQPMVASGAVQHDAAYGTPFIYRGNVTAVKRWLNTTSSFLIATNQYDDAGNVISTIDPLGHKTSFEFTDSWANSACAPAGQGKAYVTKVTNALNQISRRSYYSCTGQIASSIDANNNQTSFQFDALWRLTRITYPPQVVNGSSVNGVTNFTYNDAPGTLSVEKTKTIDGVRSTDEFYYFDDLGREVSHSTASDEATPWNKADSCYDLKDRKTFVSYPYQAATPNATPVCSGAGDAYQYDALSRVISTTHSDGSSTITSYTGRATRFTDEGNGSVRTQRLTQVDGLGRLASTCEVTSATLIGITGTPTACSQDSAANGYLTSYQYDALGNLRSVSQGGLNARSFVYDSLSRLTSDTNPESGTITYVYDNDSELSTRTRPAPNQTGSLQVVTTMSYDQLHRVTGTTYSDSTPPVTYNYDETTAFGAPLANTIGRLTSEFTGPSAAKTSGSVFSYDSMGRVVNNSQCTPQNCATGTFPLLYTYDLLGNTLMSTDGAGHTFTNTYNKALRITSTASSLADAGHPGTLLSATHFNAFGLPTTATLGNGIVEAYGYTPRGWLQSRTDKLNATTVYSVSITNPANQQTGYAPDGNVLFSNDSSNGNWGYTYDDLNRLVTAGKSTLALNYVYDRFGNRWQQNVTIGTAPAPQYTFDANNRIVGSGIVYDAAGNVTNDGTHTYTYDGENRITRVDGGTTGNYTYDANGARVRKVSGSGTLDYLYDLAGHAVTELNSSGAFTRVAIFAEGRHVASYVNGGTLFAHVDWLGTERVRTNATGGVNSSFTSLPYGDGLNSVGPDPLHFTGKMRDAESGLDEFPARYYSSTQGRWLSPDWSPVPVAIPYARLDDPRTLNLYAYVGSDPTNHADPDGHQGPQGAVQVHQDTCQGPGRGAASGSTPCGPSQVQVAQAPPAPEAAQNPVIYVTPGLRYVTLTTTSKTTTTDDKGVTATTTTTTTAFFSTKEDAAGKYSGTATRTETVRSDDPKHASSKTTYSQQDPKGLIATFGGAWVARAQQGAGAYASVNAFTTPRLSLRDVKNLVVGGALGACLVAEPCGAFAAGAGLVEGAYELHESIKNPNQ